MKMYVSVFVRSVLLRVILTIIRNLCFHVEVQSIKEGGYSSKRDYPVLKIFVSYFIFHRGATVLEGYFANT